MRNRKKYGMFKFWVICLSALLMPFLANASTYYVATSGKDANPGTETLPWRTIQKASDLMVAGDSVVVQTGSYPERVTTKRSGTSEKFIEFRANGEVTASSFTVNSHDYIKINGFKFSAELGNYSAFIKIIGTHCIISNNTIFYNGKSSISGITVGGSYNVISYNTLEGLKYPNINVFGNNHLFEGNVIKNTSHDGMRVWGNGHVIRGNTFQDMYDSGITHVDLFQTFGNNKEVSYDILIENNHFKNCKGTQIGNFTQDGIADIRDWTFRNNVFENIGLQANIFAPGFKFYNNTFYHSDQNTGGPLLFRFSSKIGGAHNAVVKNNLFIDCGSRPLNTGWYGADAGVTGFQADYNFVAGPESAGFPSKQGFKEPNGINGGNPKFVSISDSDFGLLEDSPAIDSGIPISGFSYDKNGKERPLGKAWDRGAYEGASQSPPKGLKIIESGPKL